MPMFAECHSNVDTERTFARLLHCSEHSWTSLIASYVQSGALQNALHMYEKMRGCNCNPSSHTLVVVLKACTLSTNEDIGTDMHG